MKQVKLPQIKIKLNQLWDTPSNNEKQWAQVNPSCLLAYLGIRGYANLSAPQDREASKNALPILTYFDIFKNYYANTQEENFYIIGGSPVLKISINGENIPDNDNIPSALGEINSNSVIIISPKTLKKEEIRFRVKTSQNAREQILTVDDLGSWDATGSDIRIETTKVMST